MAQQIEGNVEDEIHMRIQSKFFCTTEYDGLKHFEWDAPIIEEKLESNAVL